LQNAGSTDKGREVGNLRNGTSDDESETPIDWDFTEISLLFLE